MNIGERIKRLRKEKGLSVDYIAEKLGKNRATIYRYESSEIENLPYPILVPLANILGTTPMYLMGCEVEEVKVTQEEKQLLENYNKLNDLGKKEANKRVLELSYMPMYCDDEISATKVIELNSKEYEPKTLQDLSPTILAAHDDDLTEEEKIEADRRILEVLKNMKK